MPDVSRGNIDAFISRFDATLSALIASTYLGGGSEDYCYSLALDAGGNGLSRRQDVVSKLPHNGRRL